LSRRRVLTHPPHTLGERLQRVREALRLSQEQLAQLVGTGRAGTVSGWEQEHVIPDHATLHLIASLTRASEKTYLWLIEGGVEPPLAAHGPDDHRGTVLGTLLATPPALPRESNRGAYLAFMERVVDLAAAGKLIRAHHLLEWATMLLRTSDIVSLATKRIDILLRELPILVLELDAQERVIASHAGRVGDADMDRLIMHRPVTEVLPQIPPQLLEQAITRARQGDDIELPYTINFQDGARAYTARLYALTEDQHVMLFIQRATDVRSDELGIRKRFGEAQ